MATSIATHTILGERAAIFAPRDSSSAATTGQRANVAAGSESASAGWLARIEVRRVWMWRFLAVLAASQMYFLREVLGAYLLFAAVFAAVSAVVVSLYMMLQIAQAGLARLSHLGKRATEVRRATETAR